MSKQDQHKRYSVDYIDKALEEWEQVKAEHGL